MSVLQLAEELAASGVPVFFCNEKKRPTCPHGFLDATDDPAEVRALWNRHSGPLIGVPTGEASGFDVLDIDPRHNGDRWWLGQHHRIPATRMHRTRSGGLHVLFLHHERVRNSEGKLAPGVDTRGEGGYIIWWPATGCAVAEAPIAPWPLWLLRRLLKQPTRPKPSAKPVALNTADAAQRVAERVLSRLASASEGQRHYRLRAAACTLGGLLGQLPFGESEAKERLLRAAQDAGAEDLKNAARTVTWGIARGRQTPLNLGANR